ncbi:peptidase S8/S53 domain-containing protein [Mycena olivaceomarginata]|nr:peptidase S8/S53 domain-containing protein [Mycena olivaceomarginata]
MYLFLFCLADHSSVDCLHNTAAFHRCLATRVPVEFLSVGGPPDSTFSDLATAFLDTNTFLDGLDNPPSVVTTSYAPMENQFENSVAKKICDSYMALGVQGISILFGSGDGIGILIGRLPCVLSYVTAVGGTQGFSPEVAINLTGGGFSDLFPRPWYQTQAVDSFLKTIPPDFAGMFNKSGCGYPDVAVQGWGLDLVFNGTTFATGGTSFSSPICASIIALVNDRLGELTFRLAKRACAHANGLVRAWAWIWV